MLTEDVITAVKSMGVVRPDTTPKKRKLARLMGDEDPKEAPKVVIHKADIWEWAKANCLSFEDPVKDEGFTAGFPSFSVSEDDDSTSQEE